MAAIQPEDARGMFCGMPGQPAYLKEAQHLCVQARTKYCSAMLDADVMQVSFRMPAAPWL